MSLTVYGGDTLAVPLEHSGSSRWYQRKSRWEKKSSSQASAGKQSSSGDSAWGHAKVNFLPPSYIDFPANVSIYDAAQFLKEQRLFEVNDKLLFSQLELGDADLRPPSPAPIYDADGNRTNNRETVVKANMIAEQQRLTEAMLTTVPGFEAPPEFKSIKKVRRILIPQGQYPDYNFMGLIIGPRGCNHKRLENESGAQISIRGQGTQKDGRKCDHQTNEEINLPQHVHIAADTEEKLERAVALIEPLLDPSHPIHEEYKKKGLQQLAQATGGAGGGAMNLNRTEVVCVICNNVGHYSFECPETRFDTYERADVKCLLCGDRGHVTSDCYIARERGLTAHDIAQIKAAADAAGGGGVGGGNMMPNQNFSAAQYQNQSNYHGAQSAHTQNVTGVTQYFMQSSGYGPGTYQGQGVPVAAQVAAPPPPPPGPAGYSSGYPMAQTGFQQAFPQPPAVAQANPQATYDLAASMMQAVNFGNTHMPQFNQQAVPMAPSEAAPNAMIAPPPIEPPMPPQMPTGRAPRLPRSGPSNDPPPPPPLPPRS